MRGGWLLVLGGCAGAARPPVAPAPAPDLLPVPEQVERTAVALTCGAELEVLVPPALATVSRSDREIVAASPTAAIVVARGPRDFGADLAALVGALHVPAPDLLGPVTVTHVALDDGRLLADVSVAGRPYRLARRSAGNCTATGLEHGPAAGDGVIRAIAGDVDAPAAVAPPPRLSPIESFVEVLDGALRIGCWLDGRC